MKKLFYLIIIAGLVYGGYYLYRSYGPYIPPEEEADERFGFLSSSDPISMKEIRDFGAGWARPHPGPFIWGEMQGSTVAINYSATDDIVQKAQKYDLKLLPTLWPYADWDQRNHDDSRGCKISGDEFSRDFGRYRCNPYDWEAYKEWVGLVVERYDGDGNSDMPNLTTPITHWEVFNEPDLKPHEEGELQFYVGSGVDYRELLKQTSEAIHQSDPKAKIVIAGAAGGNKDFLDFYREVFEDPEIADYFDIANVHCISNDSFDSFNVEPYKQMLAEKEISKPIWVTEAESYISQDALTNATQLKESTKKAFELGAEKIFYTGRDFLNQPGGPKPSDEKVNITPDTSLNIKDNKSIFQNIFDSI